MGARLHALPLQLLLPTDKPALSGWTQCPFHLSLLYIHLPPEISVSVRFYLWLLLFFFFKVVFLYF